MPVDQDALVQALLNPEVIDLLSAKLSEKLMPSIEASIETRMNSVKSQIETSLSTITARITTLEMSVAQTRGTVSTIENEASTISKRVLELERYSRLNNLIFHGIEYDNYAEASSASQRSLDDPEVSLNPRTWSISSEDAIVKFVSNKLGVNITRSDISVAHRLPQRRSNTNRNLPTAPAPIIVQFNNKKIRHEILSNKSKLKPRDQAEQSQRRKFYINEHLTTHDSAIFARARQLVVSRSIYRCWTAGGVTVIKKTSNPHEPPVKIHLLSELPA